MTSTSRFALRGLCRAFPLVGASLLCSAAHAEEPGVVGQIVFIEKSDAGRYVRRISSDSPNGEEIGAGDYIHGDDRLVFFKIRLDITLCDQPASRDARQIAEPTNVLLPPDCDDPDRVRRTLYVIGGGYASNEVLPSENQRVVAMIDNPREALTAAPTSHTWGGGHDDALAWEAVAGSSDCGAFEEFLKTYPNSLFAQLAKLRMTQICGDDSQLIASVSPALVPDRTGMIFPDSGVRQLTEAEVKALSTQDLRFARSEIFARQGYKFESPELDRHFRQFSWYQPTDVTPQLSQIEMDNVRLIQAEEAQR